MDECVKVLTHINNVLEELNLHASVLGKTTPIYNNNQACVKWAYNMMTKSLRHIQMQENAIRECIQTGFATIKHVGGNVNLANIFTKEDRDREYFLAIQDQHMSLPPSFEGLAAVRCLLVLNPTLWILCQNSHPPNPESHAQDCTDQQIWVSHPVGDDIILITSKGGVVCLSSIGCIELR
eukprot:3049296-Ditylum_brightwellii.AAC.1